MGNYILKSVLTFLPILLIMSLVIFFIIQLPPGDYLTSYVAGLKAEGIGGKTRWWFWPNAFIRECVGLLQKRWKQEILFLLLLILFFGGLSMALY